MTGIPLRATKPFTTGDFIYVEDQSGGASDRGLFDTEIQSERMELIAIPNPISRVSNSETILSATLSLEDKEHNVKIEHLLIPSALNASRTKPYVKILELGDYAVAYKVSGGLNEVKTLLTAKSKNRID